MADDFNDALRAAESYAATGVGGFDPGPIPCSECGAELPASYAIECPHCGAVQHARLFLSSRRQMVPGMPPDPTLDFPRWIPPGEKGVIRLTPGLDRENPGLKIKCFDCKRPLGTIGIPRSIDLGEPPHAGLLVIDYQFKPLWEPDSELRRLDRDLHSARYAGVVFACRRRACKNPTLAILQGWSIVRTVPAPIN